jgi:hypothetical protein
MGVDVVGTGMVRVKPDGLLQLFLGSVRFSV